jgi:hypothetical protein
MNNNTKKILIISGINHKNLGGAADFIKHFWDNTYHIGMKYNVELDFLYTNDFLPASISNFLTQGKILSTVQEIAKRLKIKNKIKNTDAVIVIHPQSIGYNRSVELLHYAKKIYYYTLDNSFFCRNSYNHLPEEFSACLRCLYGNFEQAIINNCKHHPINYTYPNGSDGDNFRTYLLKKQKEIYFLAQNDNQVQLLRKHFTEAKIKKVGLWVKDFDQLQNIKIKEIKRNHSLDFDVVFHGTDVPAKGFLWIIELCKAMPNINVLIPARKPDGLIAPKNCLFRPMTWSTGLQEAVESAAITIVPSLWSAPIEAALIKSVIFAPLTASVANETAYCTEISSNIILKLDKTPAKAAEQLTIAIQEKKTLNLQAKQEWLDEFITKNKFCIENIVKTIKED